MESVEPTSAFVETMYVGTNQLGRPLNATEKRELAALLRKHDFPGASVVALRYAFKLSGSRRAAEELRDRAHARLVEQGWDPSVVPLVQCLCRFVWSEHKNERRAFVTARKTKEAFAGEQGTHFAAVPSSEDVAVRLETQHQEEAYAQKRSAALRAAFIEAGDTMNQLWLDHWLAGVDEPADMALLSARDVREFYRAAERRKRHVTRLLAAENGSEIEEDE